MRLVILALILAVGAVMGETVLAQERGFGTETRGGLDGDVIKVTTLADDGPGSLRAAVRKKGAKVVVFEVAGVIRLDTKLVINQPHITIAGQTAPAPGITISQAGMVVKTHDVVIEHLKFRIGDGPDGPEAQNRDAIAVDGAKDGKRDVSNVVIDNCSISWAIDEGVQFYRDGVVNATISDSIIAATLSNSIHPKGRHSMGLLVGNGADRVAVINNIFAHNSFRNPSVSGGSRAFIANNLIYNYRHRAIQFYGGGGGRPAEATIVGNVALTGPDHTKDALVYLPADTNPGTTIHLGNNQGTASGVPGDYLLVAEEVIDHVKVVDEPPLWPDGFVLRDPGEVEATALATAGAWPAARDPIDQAFIDQIRNGTGEIIDKPPTGALEAIETVRRPLDIPADLQRDPDGNGRTVLEDWLAGYRTLVEGPA